MITLLHSCKKTHYYISSGHLRAILSGLPTIVSDSSVIDDKMALSVATSVSNGNVLSDPLGDSAPSTNTAEDETKAVPSAAADSTSSVEGKVEGIAGMEVKKYARDAKEFEQFPDRSKEPQRNFTWAELAAYDGEDGRRMYIAVSCAVCDITDYADLHPAGPKCIKDHLGHDATAAMRATRMPQQVYSVLIKRFQVGHIVDADSSKGC